eukprot:13462811-Heterocapsa_arctica.AAC.1
MRPLAGAPRARGPGGLQAELEAASTFGAATLVQRHVPLLPEEALCDICEKPLFSRGIPGDACECRRAHMRRDHLNRPPTQQPGLGHPFQ